MARRRRRRAAALAVGSPQAAGFPLTIGLDSAKLLKRSWVKVRQIRMLANRLGRRLGRATEEELIHVFEGLEEIIGP